MIDSLCPLCQNKQKTPKKKKSKLEKTAVEDRVIPPLWSTAGLDTGLPGQAAAPGPREKRPRGPHGEIPTGGTAPTGLARRRFPFLATSRGGLPGWMNLQIPKNSPLPPPSPPHTQGLERHPSPLPGRSAADPTAPTSHRRGNYKATARDTSDRGHRLTPPKSLNPAPSTPLPDPKQPPRNGSASSGASAPRVRCAHARSRSAACRVSLPERRFAIGCRTFPSAFVFLRSDAEGGEGGSKRHGRGAVHCGAEEESHRSARAAILPASGLAPAFGACFFSSRRGAVVKGEDEGPARAVLMRAEPPRTSLGRR